MVPVVFAKLQKTCRDMHLMNKEKRSLYEHGIPRFTVVLSSTKCDTMPKSADSSRLVTMHVHEVVDHLCITTSLY
jgi:hypothetical protein